jgi:hypothetical protein
MQRLTIPRKKTASFDTFFTVFKYVHTAIRLIPSMKTLKLLDLVLFTSRQEDMTFEPLTFSKSDFPSNGMHRKSISGGKIFGRMPFRNSLAETSSSKKTSFFVI